MVSAKLSNSNILKTGKGRWSISPKIFKDAAFKKTVQSIGKEVIRKLNEYTPEQRTDQNNPQTIYFDFKTKIMEGARKREQIITPKIIRETRTLQDQLNKLQNGPQDEGTHIQAHELTKKVTQLEQQRHQHSRANGKIKNRLGETMSKYWIRSNKVVKPWDIIFVLRKPEQGENGNGETHEKNSDHMAELARTYHNNLKTQGREGRDPELRGRTIDNSLEKIETEPNLPNQ
jgi:hypothetical protein